MQAFLKTAQYEPKTPTEHVNGISVMLPLVGRQGSVFVLAYIKKQSADADELFQILSDQIHRLADSFSKEANAQHRFEQFLGALNETLAQLVKDGRFNIPIEDFNAAVGIVSDNQMFLSGAGDLSVLFLHKKPSQRYQIFNLFRSIQTEQALPTWEKPFAVVLDGDLHVGDVFCVSNQDLQRTIAADELNAVLTTLPPKGSVEKIRQYYAHNQGILLIVMKSESKDPITPQSIAKPLSDISVEHLLSAQDETSRLLEDTRPKIGAMFINIASKMLKLDKDKSRLLKDLQRNEPKGKMFMSLAQSMTKTLIRGAKRGASQAFKMGMDLSKKESRAKAITTITHSKQSLKDKISKLFKAGKHLPKTTQYLMAGAIIAVLVLIFAVTSLSKSHKSSVEQNAFDEQVVKIEDSIERATGAMIYKDENQARTLYKNAEDLIATLLVNTPEKEQVVTGLKNNIELSMDELRHIRTIPNPAFLGDLSGFGEGVVGKSLLKAGTEVIALASNNKAYSLDKAQKIFKSASQDSAVPDTIISATEEDGTIYILNDKNKVFSFNSEEGVFKDTGIGGNDAWVDLVAYANRLYLLQPPEGDSKGQIVRFNKTSSGFSSGSDWISSRTSSLSNATALTIDGSLFVLKKDGQIVRFLSGAEVGWNNEAIDPPLTKATKLWTNTDSDFIYAIEPISKRIIVYNKSNGTFVVQYKSEAFSEMTDILVDETDYTIYILSGSKLYSIAASHLTSN